MKELEGKVAIVTGAGGNIGSMTSRLLAEAGAKVTMSDVAQEPLEKAAAELKADGFDVLAVAGDVSSESDVQNVVAQTVERFGAVHILDNNAGGTTIVGNDLTVLDMDVDLWDRMYGTNVKGPMLFCKHVIPHMISAGGGSIINISSGTSLAGTNMFTAYASSKGALNTLTKYVASAHGAQGIRCNALALGIVLRPGTDPSAMGLQDYVKHHIVGRTGESTDIANAVLFLASDRSAFITGQVISVDGGFFAHLPTFSNP
jgi:NAD(P)-dependent dehydrogenase (short-subunit alcohol dehydrogenase family)